MNCSIIYVPVSQAASDIIPIVSARAPLHLASSSQHARHEYVSPLCKPQASMTSISSSICGLTRIRFDKLNSVAVPSRDRFWRPASVPQMETYKRAQRQYSKQMNQEISIQRTREIVYKRPEPVTPISQRTLSV
jgi:hypothetical protein